MNDATIFYGLKMLHIGALIFWLGPSLGAWWVLRGVRHVYGDNERPSIISHRLFVNILLVEHVAFVALLLSGAAMAIIFQFYSHAWLQWKLLIIVVLLLPLEFADIYWGNVKLARLFKVGENSAEHPEYEKTLHVYHTVLTYSAMVIVPLSILMIFYLVIAKPALPVLF
ncbi:hypothetical protein TDB9533_03465 [Thalassocella blandensis]|nr:hypothetical protein TDB9533_03465 [Thalassocella blandensis]